MTFKIVIHTFHVDTPFESHINTPNLVVKRSVAQKTYDLQTVNAVLNLSCDLDLIYTNPLYHKMLQLMMLYPKTEFGCNKRISC